MQCLVLYHNVMYCNVLCSVMYHIVMYIVIYCSVMYCIILFCIVLYILCFRLELFKSNCGTISNRKMISIKFTARKVSEKIVKKNFSKSDLLFRFHRLQHQPLQVMLGRQGLEVVSH